MMGWIDDCVDDTLLVADFFGSRKFGEGPFFGQRKARALARHTKYKPATLPPLLSLAGSAATAETFRKASRGYRDPVIIRGLMSATDAVERWKTTYLEELCGESRYRFIESSNDDVVSGTAVVSQGTVGELIRSLRSGKDSRYLAGVSQIFNDHPQLIADLQFERLSNLLRNSYSQKSFDALNLFIGGPLTRSRIHCAFAGNFFVNVVGRKHWRLLPPRYKYLLLPMPMRPFIYSATYFDPLDQNPERCEFVRRLPFYDVILEPGDVLYNGPWWWHQVENLDQLNIGCAIRFGAFVADYMNNTTFTMLSLQPVLYSLMGFFKVTRGMRSNGQDFRQYLLQFLDRLQNSRRLERKEPPRST